MFGYFRVASEMRDFALIMPAKWHRESTFQWLRQFRGPFLTAKPTYVMVQQRG